jgi:mRNA-degrading endonuclease RelE of RelBE toxin-antitoxin system
MTNTPKEDIELREHKWALLAKYASQIRDFAKEQRDMAHKEIEELLKNQKSGLRESPPVMVYGTLLNTRSGTERRHIEEYRKKG